MRYIDACEHGDWHLHLWPAGEEHSADTTCHRIPFCCRSWRHQGECRLWRGALDFWRIAEGIKKRQDWVYIVLTFRQGTAQERFQTYYKAGKSWDKLRKRLSRQYGQSHYIQTWERHQLGGCHVNLLYANQEVFSQVNQDWRKWRRDFLKAHAVSSGFGPICWVEPMDGDVLSVAGYLTKLANELTGSGYKNQIPVDAPPHFRRIRASRGILPSKPIPDLTGELVRTPLPEYNYEQPANRQPCGCHGDSSLTKGERVHATDTNIMAITS